MTDFVQRNILNKIQWSLIFTMYLIVWTRHSHLMEEGFQFFQHCNGCRHCALLLVQPSQSLNILPTLLLTLYSGKNVFTVAIWMKTFFWLQIFDFDRHCYYLPLSLSVWKWMLSSLLITDWFGILVGKGSAIAVFSGRLVSQSDETEQNRVVQTGYVYPEIWTFLQSGNQYHWQVEFICTCALYKKHIGFI